MTVRGRFSRALGSALQDAQLKPRDGAAVALARRYAQLMDEAQALADEAELIEPETDAQARRLAALRLKVDAQSVVSDLGPKLQSVLTALGMTLAGRASSVPLKAGSVGNPAAAAKVDELRQRRLQRVAKAADIPG